MNARTLLEKIGVTNEIKEIKEASLIYKNAVEESYQVVTELGEIDFRIIKLADKTVSKIEYNDTRYTFNRSVNLMVDFEEEVTI